MSSLENEGTDKKDEINKLVEKINLSNNTEQMVTPWDVKGEVVNGVQVGINYDKLMNQFGCSGLTREIIDRFERLIGEPAHVLIKRRVFYCHRDFEKILDCFEQKKPFYLYTGRGPSSESMHLGHMVPFFVCQYLQRVFDCFIVIQMTDDEKFLVKEQLTLEDCKRFAVENAKDIIAAGFNPEKTFIFSDVAYFGHMYETVLHVQKMINYNQTRSVFGFEESDPIGKISFPATQIAPCFSQAFPHIFKGVKDIPCLIPYAIDQDPYFRLCRDIAPRLKCHKPASLCSKFFPALQGNSTKMSASSDSSAIFMTDTDEQIKNKINKYAFSGGGATLEAHRQNGADLSVDVPFQYLSFFLEDDEELKSIEIEYGSGRMSTGAVKQRCIQVIQEIIKKFQERRRNVTDEVAKHFMSVRNA
jgi:tryptophanyl-tRNA synthetase